MVSNKAKAKNVEGHEEVKEKAVKKNLHCQHCYERFVLDTSVFVNPASISGFAKTKHSAVETFANLALDCKNAKFYMPPSAYNELIHFIPSANVLGSLIFIKRAPLNTQIPAEVLRSFVGEMRERTNKGLRIAERYVREAAQLKPEEAKEGKDSVLSSKLKAMREQYREALRAGILDSKADVDIALLAHTLGATLVTADEGLMSFASHIGVAYMEPANFFEWLKKHCKVSQP